MNMDLFKKIVLEVETWKAKPTIYLNMDGEPLLDKQLPERLSILREIDLARKATLQTNAEFLTSEASTAILKAGIPWIVIGFDGGSKAVYEGHRVGCHYDVVLKNITTFVRLRRSLKGMTSVGIKFVRTKQNAHEVADAYKLFAGILNPWLDVFYDQVSVNWGNPDLEDVVLAGAQRDASLQYCGHPDTDLVVFADGSIASCCFDYNLSVFGGPLGNVHQDTLLDVWRGRSFEKLRRNLRLPGTDGKPAKCLTCNESFHWTPQSYISEPAIESRFAQVHDCGFTYYFTANLTARRLMLFLIVARSRGPSWALRRVAFLLRHRFGTR